MADETVCASLTFADRLAQERCGRAHLQGPATAEDAADADGDHEVLKMMRGSQGVVVTKEEYGQSAMRRHKIVGAAAGAVQFTPEDRARMVRIETQMVRLETRLLIMDAKADNVQVRLYNNAAKHAEHMLRPLKKEAAEGDEAVGQLPSDGTFPATRGHLLELSAEALNALEDFYGRRFTGRGVAARRQEFSIFIGSSA